MQSTVELADLDELVEQLDAQITELDSADRGEAISLLACSGGCGGGWSWHWYC
ncbi:hypothetical protein L6E12_16370 [Actinokineospora sp. PR83]|uniref:hypothetical protein n=1 Tax=Actinokineospora sp. PR83 TaxID=2884908 RepID=UPI001F2711DE|nr:hypothetical protein [Actinokineospora sp. PR83]MCG8917362.1 hypothetical protein [Actinokineospora sp. PR83]